MTDKPMTYLEWRAKIVADDIEAGCKDIELVTDKPMTVGDILNILEFVDKHTPVVVNHHCAYLFYKIESVKISKIKGKKYIVIDPNDKSEEMYELIDRGVK